MPNCSDCPSFMPQGQPQVDALGSSLGVDICGRLGYVLGSPGQSDVQRDTTREDRATGCGVHGDPFTWQPVDIRRFKPQMFMPDMARLVPNQSGQNEVRSCVQCDHFIAPGDAFSQYGIQAGICSAQGTLVPERSQQPIARSCEYRTTKVPGSLRPELKLLADLDPMNGVSVINVSGRPYTSVVVDNDKHSVDPREYVSDRPVTPGERARFVRAWRWIDDPEGIHDHLEVPIFDGRALCAHYGIADCAVYNESGEIIGYDNRLTYGNYRPDLYRDHMGLLYDLMAEFFVNEKVPFLIGPAGSGKTEAAAYAAWLMDIPLHVIPIDKGTEPYMLMGEAGLISDPTGTHNIKTWEEGSLSAWIEVPAVIVVDEPNVKSEIFISLRTLAGAAKELMVNGKRRRLGQYTWLMFTGNPDWLPEYIGTEMMNAADLDRVTPIYVDYPSPAVERQIILEHCQDSGYTPSDDTLDQIIQIGQEIRARIGDGTLPIAWGIRTQIKVAMGTRTYSLLKAYRRGILDGLEPAKVDVITPIISMVVD